MCASLPKQGLETKGIEPTLLALSKTRISGRGGAFSGAPLAQEAAHHELDRLAEVWPGLSEAVRVEILRLAGVLR